MDVLFCHGLESGPVGRKTLALRGAGHLVTAPDGRGQTLAARVEQVRAVLRDRGPFDVVVGSSFGGATAVCALLTVECRLHPRRLILCAPALHVPEPPATELGLHPPCPTIILHGTRDTVVPIEGSRRFAALGAVLKEVDDDHRLSRSMDRLLELVAAD